MIKKAKIFIHGAATVFWITAAAPLIIAEPEAEPLKRRIYYTTAFILARLNKVNISKNVTGES